MKYLNSSNSSHIWLDSKQDTACKMYSTGGIKSSLLPSSEKLKRVCKNCLNLQGKYQKQVVKSKAGKLGKSSRKTIKNKMILEKLVIAEVALHDIAAYGAGDEAMTAANAIDEMREIGFKNGGEA